MSTICELQLRITRKTYNFTGTWSVNKIGTVYLVVQIKGSVLDSVGTFEFDMEHLKKAKDISVEML